MSDYIKNQKGDLLSFLEWWDTEGPRKFISSSPSQDAINVMTIHKSKGLGFRAVIIPFVDWSFSGKENKTLWISPSVAPFNEIPIVPLPSDRLMHLQFSKTITIWRGLNPI